MGDNHDWSQKENAGKQQKAVEYEMAVFEEENMYEDPGEFIEPTVKDTELCDLAYEDVATGAGNGKEAIEDDEVYCEI